MTDRRCSRLFVCVRVAAAATVAVLSGMFLQPAEGGHTRGFIYTIEQGGGAPQGVIPLLDADDVKTFYGYPGGANRSDTGLEQSDTSLLFLYEDIQGRVSLVMIHDANDRSGGKAVFDFVGIPDGTTFVVQDDPEDSYVAPPGGTATVTWRWNDANTDGGALSGSLERQAWTITITPRFPPEGGQTAGKITTWKFLTGRLDSPTEIGLDVTAPIIIKAIPAGLQVVTSARLTAEGQSCQVATDNGPLTANLSVIVEGTLQIAGQQIIAPDGNGGTLITFDGETPANSTLTFTVIVDGGTPQVVPAVPVSGHFSAVATVTPPPPVVTFTTGPVIDLSGAGFAFQLAGTTVSTGPWTLTAADATLLKVTISQDFPQIGWTAQIEAEAEPRLTFANVSGCELVGTGQRHTTVRSGFVDIKPGSFPNPINPSSGGVVPVAILGSESFDVRTIDAATIEIDDDRQPGNGVAPTRVQKSLADVNGDGFPDLSLKFDTTALDAAGLLGDKRLFITGAIGNGGAQVLGSDAICLPGNCGQ
jgi:hypothetical protein